MMSLSLMPAFAAGLPAHPVRRRRLLRGYARAGHAFAGRDAHHQAAAP